MPDKRILKPGWAGEPEPSELVFLKERLEKDQRLAVRWGFDSTSTNRPEWAILQLAMWGPQASGTQYYPNASEY